MAYCWKTTNIFNNPYFIKIVCIHINKKHPASDLEMELFSPVKYSSPQAFLVYIQISLCTHI